MYSNLPYFVFGFHGCDIETKEAVLHGKEDLEPSKNSYDWLGSGIYFWEQNQQRAMEFARLAHNNPGKYTSKPINTPAVLGAVIDLGHCLNLMDSFHTKRLSEAYSVLEHALKQTGGKLPTNKGRQPDKPVRELDKSVIETLHIMMGTGDQTRPYDTVRGLFMEGDEVYPGAKFQQNTHIQICVRNINCIKAFFDPREKVDNGFSKLD